VLWSCARFLVNNVNKHVALLNWYTIDILVSLYQIIVFPSLQNVHLGGPHLSCYWDDKYHRHLGVETLRGVR